MSEISLAMLNFIEGGMCRLHGHPGGMLATGCLPEVQFREIDDAYDCIIGQIVKMTDQPEKWLIRPHDAP